MPIKTKSKSRVELDGLKELFKALDGLPNVLKAQTLRSVNRQAAKIPQKEMKSKSPSRTVSDSIKIQADRSNKSGVMVGPTYHLARWFEYGTKVRATRTGANRGVMNPEPFIEKAIDASIDDTVKFINTNLGDLVAKFLTNKLKRSKRIKGF